MAKWQNDLMLDAALNYISTNSVEMYVCSGQPANYAGIAAVALTGAITPTFQSLANGTTSGRKLAVDAKADAAITSSGDATHIVLSSATVLLYVTTSTTQALSSGGTVSVPAWNIELADAV